MRVNAVPINSSSFELHWSPPPEEEQNGAITHYGINITVQKTGETFQIITKDSVPSHTLYGLHPHYKYTYSVTTFTTVGNGPYSSSHILQMPQDGMFVLHVFALHEKLTLLSDSSLHFTI